MQAHAHIIGNGSTKVLVYPGWMGDHTVFAPTFESWNLSEFTIAFMDYRGYGKSREMSGDYSIEEIARDGIAIADSLGWSDFNVVGHSMGGMVAQKTCVLASERVKGAVCLTPVPASGYPMDEDNTALFVGATKADMNRRKILDFTTGLRLAGTWLDKMVTASRETTTEAAYAGYLDAWVKTDFSSEVKGMKTPFLVAVGEHDLAINKDMVASTYGEWLDNCEIEVMGNTGHYPMQEVPVYLVKIIEDFLGKHNG